MHLRCTAVLSTTWTVSTHDDVGHRLLLPVVVMLNSLVLAEAVVVTLAVSRRHVVACLRSQRRKLGLRRSSVALLLWPLLRRRVLLITVLRRKASLHASSRCFPRRRRSSVGRLSRRLLHLRCPRSTSGLAVENARLLPVAILPRIGHVGGPLHAGG